MHSLLIINEWLLPSLKENDGYKRDEPGYPLLILWTVSRFLTNLILNLKARSLIQGLDGHHGEVIPQRLLLVEVVQAFAQR